MDHRVKPGGDECGMPCPQASCSRTTKCSRLVEAGINSLDPKVQAISEVVNAF